ncbi:MAG: FKBP-type peptidyl-prolyl cis-trans isomerase [Thermodesulfobacteriota bacterium]
MSRFKTTLALIVAGCFLFSGSLLPAAEEGPATQQEKISYVLGHTIITNLKEDFQVDAEALVQGVEDGLAGESLLSDEEMQATMAAFQQQLQQEQQEKQQKEAAANKAAGRKFLEKNKEKKGVVTLPSGLQYKVLEEGDGPSPSPSDTVVCHYEGRTVDGQVFDSSKQRGEPATFQVDGVIKGWTDALQLMAVGSKWMLYIPPDLAYGEQGAGQVIPPGSTLIFEVELLEIKESGPSDSQKD